MSCLYGCYMDPWSKTEIDLDSFFFGLVLLFYRINDRKGKSYLSYLFILNLKTIPQQDTNISEIEVCRCTFSRRNLVPTVNSYSITRRIHERVSGNSLLSLLSTRPGKVSIVIFEVRDEGGVSLGSGTPLLFPSPNRFSFIHPKNLYP